MSQLRSEASDSELCAQKLRLAFDLFDAGVELKRVSLRREWPQATASELHAKLQEWLFDRPGAPLGDVSGPVHLRR